jgi:hypothetical protein
VGEHFEAFGFACKFEHAEGAADVDVDGVVDAGVEVDAGCAVHYHLH